jgi:hypothetical protein
MDTAASSGTADNGCQPGLAAVLTREVFYSHLETENSWQVTSALRPRRINVAMSIKTDVSVEQTTLERTRHSSRLAFGCDINPKTRSPPGFARGLGEMKGRARRIAIVVVARKLLIALFRYTENGEIPAGAIFRTHIHYSKQCWLCEEHHRPPQWSPKTPAQVGRVYWGLASCMRHYSYGFHAESDRMQGCAAKAAAQRRPKSVMISGLNPVENISQFMRENWLSNRVFKSYEDIVDHCCQAWRKLPTDLRKSCLSVAANGPMSSDQCGSRRE